jgi:alkylation response protein AidB-like acyl-CoA dehydrogenase
VWYEDVRVPVANLVGEEGGSFKQTMRQLEHERGGIDRLLSNHALYLDAKARADVSDMRMRQRIARLETGYRLGRLLVLRETLQQAPRGFSAATKTFCTEHEQAVAEFAAATFGADLTVWGEGARAYCYSPAYTIMGGTSNVLRNILGERLLGLPREPA